MSERVLGGFVLAIAVGGLAGWALGHFIPNWAAGGGGALIGGVVGRSWLTNRA